MNLRKKIKEITTISLIATSLVGGIYGAYTLGGNQTKISAYNPQTNNIVMLKENDSILTRSNYSGPTTTINKEGELIKKGRGMIAWAGGGGYVNHEITKKDNNSAKIDFKFIKNLESKIN